MRYKPFLLLMVSALSLPGCAASEFGKLPTGPEAYKIAPPLKDDAIVGDYLISPGDLVTLSVLEEPDLALDKVPVDQSGRIQVPLVGSIQLAGLTPSQATVLIQQQLGAKYIRNPQVALNVIQPVEQLVSVEGQVTKAGTYPIGPDTTLLSAVSMAQSPTRIARLDDVVIFRTVGGQRLAARFDLKRIRAGADPDPRILGGDVVVVGFSSSKSIYRDVLTAAPIFNVFTRF